MKKLIVKKLIAENITANLIPELLDANLIEWQGIDACNWKDTYPYCPDAAFRIAYTHNAILLHYKVTELSVRATAEDAGRVWEDSCVEFFSIPAADGVYYNVECNCTAHLLVAVGKDREQRTPAPTDVYESIGRWSSLGHGTFKEQQGPISWQVALCIPYSTFFQHHIQTLDKMTVRANFYKCGDLLAQPHFLSWNKIDLPTPNFHCPPYFGELTFGR